MSATSFFEHKGVDISVETDDTRIRIAVGNSAEKRHQQVRSAPGVVCWANETNEIIAIEIDAREVCGNNELNE